MTEAAFLNAVGLFLLGLLRFSGFFLYTPVFAETFIPAQVKAGISAICALIILPHLISTQTLPLLSIPEYGVMAVKELALGFALSYMVMVVSATMRMAGGIIGMQVGFSFVQVADPSSNQGLGIVSEFFQLAGTLVFLVIGGHLMLLEAFFKSFDMVPLAGLVINGGIVEEIMLYTRMIFVCGLQISMPVVAIILVGDVALGIIARTVPKMNIFQLGFALKIIAGLWVMMVIMPYLNDIVKYLLGLSMEKVYLLLGEMA
ncbi:MAG TPA: flagellar biosynthetic protein FliR [Candidatus Rifleibacterium sp.]|nr:flagellar biosynthetic protein FliR [Candidatus Rifleibacterium sp.]HPT46937.1 flagellar biosynthetic protein FliR [Candidatus Rifleibacterium sp.]